MGTGQGLGMGTGTHGLGMGTGTHGLGMGTGQGLGMGTGTHGLGMGQTNYGTSTQNPMSNLTAQQHHSQLQQQIQILQSSPFGDSPLFRNSINVSTHTQTHFSIQ